MFKVIRLYTGLIRTELGVTILLAGFYFLFFFAMKSLILFFPLFGSYVGCTGYYFNKGIHRVLGGESSADADLLNLLPISDKDMVLGKVLLCSVWISAVVSASLATYSVQLENREKLIMYFLSMGFSSVETVIVLAFIPLVLLLINGMICSGILWTHKLLYREGRRQKWKMAVTVFSGIGFGAMFVPLIKGWLDIIRVCPWELAVVLAGIAVLATGVRLMMRLLF